MLKRFLAKSVGISVVVFQYGCIAHCTFEFVGDFVICSGPSMQPTINPGDILLREHLIFTRKLEIGDVVICRSASNPKEHICKRVAGLAGDYVSSSWSKTVPRGHVWLEGDNEKNSTDSRSYGPIPYGLIRSRAILRVWPPSGFGVIPPKSSSGK